MINGSDGGPARAEVAQGELAQVEVLIVGCGPVGLVAAGLLAAEGVTTLVVERNPTTSDQAKAISIDDESLRTLQRAGLASVVYPVLQPGTGTRYHGADGVPLVHARGRQPYRLGHPFKSSFAQPDLERALLEAISRSSCVQVAFSTELVGLRTVQGGSAPEAVDCSLRRADGSRLSARASYVIGCDGGRSTVRRLAGVEMDGRAFAERWLVVDTVDDPHRERYGMHHGDPARPHVIIPGPGGRCRYEFKLSADEGGEEGAPLEGLAVELVGRHREIRPDQVERCVAYRFNALMARQWRKGRILLAGDAAHMMPPFAGQGLNSGVRDADNLCWKLAAVLRGRASDAILDTYEQERRPHAQAMIDLSVRLGRVVMTSNRAVAGVRDRAVRVALHLPRSERWLREMRFRPTAVYHRGFVAVPEGAAGDGPAGALIGRILPQPRVLDAEGRLILLDEALGPELAVLGVACPEEVWSDADFSVLSRFGCRLVDVALDDMMAVDHPAGAGLAARTGVADADGALQQLLAPVRGRMVVVRPDRYVAAVVAPHLLGGAMSALRRYAPGAAPAHGIRLASPPLPRP